MKAVGFVVKHSNLCMHLCDEEQRGEKDCNGSDGNSDEGMLVAWQ